jgi:hypothetical protein
VLGLRCIRVKPPRGPSHVRVNVLSGSQAFAVGGGSSKRVRATCPAGYVATGYGIDRSRAGSAAAQLVLESTVPAARSWAFRVRNLGTASQRVSMQLRCMSASAAGDQAGRPGAERFSIARLAFSESPGSGAVSHSCASGRYAVATGYALPDGSGLRASAFPDGPRVGRWSFTGSSGTGTRTYLTCLSLRTRFR